MENSATSRAEMTEIVLPEDSNSRGSIFGGRVLALIDKCASIVALRHTRSGVVTVSFDSVEFRNPVHVGDILILHGHINAAFGSSMEIEVQTFSEDPLSGEKNLTAQAFVTMVAVDKDGKPIPARPLALTTDEERERFEAATQRRTRRRTTR